MLRICCFILMMMLLSDTMGWSIDDIVNHISICSQLPDYGRCSAHTRMWYYSRQHKSCLPFVYSTCGGNTNRFYTKSECEQYCVYVRGR
ncbi:kunitz-type serine protease inhibitor homolog delta-dendrotoxin-like isoform X1 [Drosophila novamexicana]|uniref:kunitz-type serine protease inhibitor homolog delta-dendrotoxin-like isoform X1 n=2 Tax=Drosophila novamexicana TaxID=47314 RepID=UPI0011E5E9BD|nr:kunitz-type serine protease inhibitor homolog delta-dendrotoxin-like isoform X1 [Drosophila novamexicana]